jgi:hypothetical protein
MTENSLLKKIFKWLNELGDLWITKDKLSEKNFLRTVSCGASFFEQTVSDFLRLNSYPSSGQAGAQPAGATSLPVCPASPEYKEKVRAMVEALEVNFHANELTWDQFYALQLMMLPMYPEAELRGKRATLRDQFYLRAPQHLIAMYEKSAPPALDPATSYSAVLCDALYLQRELATIDTYRPHQELKRNTITYELYVSLVVVLFFELLLGGIIWLFGIQHAHAMNRPSSEAAFPFILIVMMLGALGAAVSSQRRLQESFDADSSILNSTRYVGSGVGVKLAPFQGSVFAALLLFILYSGLITSFTTVILPDVTKTPAIVSASPAQAPKAAPGPTAPPSQAIAATTASATPASATSVAPTAPAVAPTVSAMPSVAVSATPPANGMTPTASPAVSVAKKDNNQADFPKMGPITRAMLFLFGPRDTVEYAKVLVYAFLAGFAERLVPDTLDRLTGSKK